MRFKHGYVCGRTVSLIDGNFYRDKVVTFHMLMDVADDSQLMFSLHVTNRQAMKCIRRTSVVLHSR